MWCSLCVFFVFFVVEICGVPSVVQAMVVLYVCLDVCIHVCVWGGTQMYVRRQSFAHMYVCTRIACTDNDTRAVTSLHDRSLLLCR